jgi:hypothetical protein
MFSCSREETFTSDFDFGNGTFREPFVGILKHRPAILTKSLDYPPCSWLIPDTVYLEKSFIVRFNEECLRSNSSAYIILSDSNGNIPEGITFYFNGKPSKSGKILIPVSKNREEVTIGLKIDPAVGSKKFEGNVYIEGNELDIVNEVSLQQKNNVVANWSFEQQRGWSPLWIIWIVIAILILLLFLALLYCIYKISPYIAGFFANIFSSAGAITSSPIITASSLTGNTRKFNNVEERKRIYEKRMPGEHTQPRYEFDRSVRSDFFKRLSDNKKLLKKLLKGKKLLENDIQRLKDGKVPDGYQVRHMKSKGSYGTDKCKNLKLVQNTSCHQIEPAQFTIKKHKSLGDYLYEKLAQKLTDKLRKTRLKYESDIQLPATNEGIEKLVAIVKEKYKIDLSDVYKLILSETDGFNENGVFLYGSDTKLIKDYSDRFINGLLQANTLWHKTEEFSQYLFYAESDLYVFVQSIKDKTYSCRVRDNFDELISTYKEDKFFETVFNLAVDNFLC